MSLEMERVQVPTPQGGMQAAMWRHPAGTAYAPIVLFHESLGCVEAWRGFPAALAEVSGRDVIAYDRIGYGHSAPRQTPPGEGFIEAEAGFALPCLQAVFGFRSFVALGHSTGGSMALVAGARLPAQCEAVITLAAHVFVEDVTLAGVREARQAYAELPARFERLQRLHGSRARWVLDAWLDTWLSPAFAGWNLHPLLPQIACPVLAIHGCADPFGSITHAQRIASGVGGRGQTLLLPECGHVPQRDCPEHVLQGIASWLRGDA